jgi:hypothetical protein
LKQTADPGRAFVDLERAVKRLSRKVEAFLEEEESDGEEVETYAGGNPAI